MADSREYHYPTSDSEMSGEEEDEEENDKEEDPQLQVKVMNPGEAHIRNEFLLFSLLPHQVD